MYIFWILIFIFVTLILIGSFCVFLNITPVFLQLIFFSIAACLPAFMNTYGQNTIVALLFVLATAGILVAGLQVLGIINIGLKSSVL